jgi:hypothetical protein
VAKENSADAEAMVECGADGTARNIPTMRVIADRVAAAPRGSVQWSSAVPESRRIALDPERMQVAAHLAVRPADDVLLAIGDEPVIVRRVSSPNKRIETSLDFASAETLRHPEVPLLVNVMFEQLLGGELLDAIAISDRGAGAAMVVPSDGAGTMADATRSGDSRPLRDAVQPLLVAALVVLLWEMIALALQWRRLRDVAGAKSG